MSELTQHPEQFGLDSRRPRRNREGQTIDVKTPLSLTITLLVSVTFVACGNGGNGAPQATDYSQASHWLSLPATVYPVDVFYLYPTAWTPANNPDIPQICAIDDATMLIGASEEFARQATAFETAGNIYAPYYRQDDNAATDREQVRAGIPTLDGIAAFDYYIKHYNNGRQCILVGHSQGANVLSNLLAGYMSANPNVYKNMVAAYVIGYSVSAAYLADNPHLKCAQGADDTGVIMSYNTEAPDVDPAQNPVLYAGVGLVINPISWTRDETPASQAEGLGSFMPNSRGAAGGGAVGPGAFGPVAQDCDAQVNIADGVLICSTASEGLMYSMSGALGMGVYHTFDIPFYYYNLRANAANRVAQFLKNQ